jgi:hypothetical protein
VLALASRCLVLMYKVATCHSSTSCYVVSGTLFPISGGRPALPVPSPAAISLLSLLESPQPAPLWGRHDLRVTIRSRFRQSTTAKISRSAFPILLFTTVYPSNAIVYRKRDHHLNSFWLRGGYGRVCGGRRALLAADTREAAPSKGAASRD